MLVYAYTHFGCYIWMIAIAVITYFVCNALKKSFTGLTCKIADGNARFAVNTTAGIVMSVAVAYIVGKFGCLLFGTSVKWIWFVAAGLLANFVYCIIEKHSDYEATAFGKVFVKALKASEIDVDLKDLPAMTKRINEIVTAYSKSEKNGHYATVKKVATDVAGAVEISAEEAQKIEDEIAARKSAGANVSNAEELLRVAKEDGRLTVAESEAILASLRAHQ